MTMSGLNHTAKEVRLPIHPQLDEKDISQIVEYLKSPAQ